MLRSLGNAARAKTSSLQGPCGRHDNVHKAFVALAIFNTCTGCALQNKPDFDVAKDLCTVTRCRNGVEIETFKDCFDGDPCTVDACFTKLADVLLETQPGQKGGDVVNAPGAGIARRGGRHAENLALW